MILAVAVSAAIIAVGALGGEGIRALSAATAPKLPPPECHEGYSYDGPAIPPEIARESNAMALEMYRRLSAGDAAGENYAFSPLAAYLAASLLYEGARGETAAQLRDAFALDPDNDARRAQASQAAAAVRAHDPCARLYMPSALWVDRDAALPGAEFAAVAGDVYGAEVRAVDFGDPADGADRIDRWAWRETRGSVEDVVGGPLDSTAVLSSVASFEGTWHYPFVPSRPDPYARPASYLDPFYRDNLNESSVPNPYASAPAGMGPFWRADGTIVNADFMMTTAFFEAYGSGNIEPTVLQAINIPYGGGRLSMLAVMPPEADGLPGLADSITTELLGEWMNFPYRNVGSPTDLRMPVFAIRASYTFDELLGNTGVAGALVPGAANLSGIGPDADGLGVSLAAHDVFVDVGMEGTDAKYSGWIRDAAPDWVTLDRPFLFFIYEEESDAILLMGSVSDPAAAR